MRWLRVILRRDRYRVEESVKFGTKNLVCVRNKSSLGAPCASDPGEKAGISIFDNLFIGMKTRLINTTMVYNAFSSQN